MVRSMSSNGSVGNECDDRMYGSFYLDQCEFAIPSDRIVEVVNLPNQLVEIPLTPKFVRGAFDLRGTIVAVVDLMILFERGTSNLDADKVAILEYDGQFIGVLLDRIGRVFRGHSENLNKFDADSSTPFVDGIFRDSQGGELIQVIDIASLFTLAEVPKGLPKEKTQRVVSHRNPGDRRQYLMFSLEDFKCALPLNEIQEVFQLEGIDHSPLSGGLSCLGTTNLRNGSLPILDLFALLGNREISFNSDRFAGKDVVVMKANDVLIGFLVESIDDIFFSELNEFISYPSTDLIQQNWFKGSIVKEDSPEVYVFDHNKLLGHHEVVEVAKVHGRLSAKPLQCRSIQTESHADAKKSFLIFSSDAKYAVGLEQVQEIIDLPQNLTRPPGLSEKYLGIHNLRNEVSVAVAELGKPGSDALGNNQARQRKVLIFDSNGGKAGLVIDSLDSIESVGTGKIYSSDNVPDGSIPSEELLQIKGKSNQIQTVPIVDLSNMFNFAINGFT